MSYLRLLVDYRPEECPKCQFSVTEVFFIFFHLILSLQGGALFFSPVSEQQYSLTSQNSLRHVMWLVTAKIILLSCHPPLLTFWGFFPSLARH